VLASPQTFTPILSHQQAPAPPAQPQVAYQPPAPSQPPTLLQPPAPHQTPAFYQATYRAPVPHQALALLQAFAPLQNPAQLQAPCPPGTDSDSTPLPTISRASAHKPPVSRRLSLLETISNHHSAQQQDLVGGAHVVSLHIVHAMCGGDAHFWYALRRPLKCPTIKRESRKQMMCCH
jgi:hypothetical protein